jgi:hypothetical protein
MGDILEISLRDFHVVRGDSSELNADLMHSGTPAQSVPEIKHSANRRLRVGRRRLRRERCVLPRQGAILVWRLEVYLTKLGAGSV